MPFDPNYLQSLKQDGSYAIALSHARHHLVQLPGNVKAYRSHLSHNAPGAEPALEKINNKAFYAYLAAAIVKHTLKIRLKNPNYETYLNQPFARFLSLKEKVEKILFDEGFTRGALKLHWENGSNFFNLLKSDFDQFGPLVVDLYPIFDPYDVAYYRFPNANTYSVDGRFGIVANIDVPAEEVFIYLPLGRSVRSYEQSALVPYSASFLDKWARVRLPASKPLWYRLNNIKNSALFTKSS